jgi:hypothetical protein
MSAIGIFIQFCDIGYYFRSQGIEMDISDQFFKISILLADDGFVPVLKKMSMAAVPSVKIYSVSCKKTPH